MNIVCIICSDLLTPADDVFHTPCGHIFHFHCVSQWLERSKSCPQCREKTNHNKIHRLYFNFSNNDSVIEDPTSLQDQIDKLKFQLLLKEKDVKFFSEKVKTLEKQTAGLRGEVRKVESELNAKNSAIYALKEQTQFFKDQCKEADVAKVEMERLKKKVNDLRNLQILMDAPANEVDAMISTTKDPTTLVTYISVMKREMTTCLTKRRELRARVQNLQQELTKVSMERNFLAEEHDHRKTLEEKLAICRAEKMSLQEKLQEQECFIKEMKKCHPVSFTEMDSDSTEQVSRVRQIESDEDNDNLRKAEPAKRQRPRNSIQENESDEVLDSPEVVLRSHGIVALKERHDDGEMKKRLGSHFLAKKPKLSWLSESSSSTRENGMAYDGYGGHSRVDVFPTPITAPKLIKRPKVTTKGKKPKLDTGRNQKLGGFMIDLTGNSSENAM